MNSVRSTREQAACRGHVFLASEIVDGKVRPATSWTTLRKAMVPFVKILRGRTKL